MRWKRLIKCAGGLRCAEVEPTNLDEIPPGAIVKLEYTCGGCGTHYAWDSATQQRRIVEQPSRPSGGIMLEPGESVRQEFVILDPHRRN